MTSFRVALDVAGVASVAAAVVAAVAHVAAGFLLLLLGSLTEVRPMYLMDSTDCRIAVCSLVADTANLSKV